MWFGRPRCRRNRSVQERLPFGILRERMIRLDRLADVMADVAHVERADEYNDKVLVRCHSDPLPAAARGREDRSAGIHPETIAVAAASGPAGAPTVRLARRPHPVCGHDLLSLPATPIEPQQ